MIMNYLKTLSLFLCVGCATKYIIPGNRFITPESQGGLFNSQIELQQTGANQLTILASGTELGDGVSTFNKIRTGFLLSSSVFESFDFVWSHTGGGNSMVGGKYQLIGASRTGNATGHKAAVAILFGGNEHETQEGDVEFELNGREYLALYGYRFSPNIFPYVSLSYANYNFNGVVKVGALSGQEPQFATNSLGLNTGAEFLFDSFFIKVEGTYQKLETTNTDEKENFLVGYSAGYSW